MAEKVTIFEVGPRDGLQNEPKIVSLKTKLRFVEGLIEAGLREIELGAFVRPDRVPQMADTAKLYYEILDGRLARRGVKFWSLVPNRKGFERALRAGATQLAVFTAATETFARRNIGMSINESFKEFERIIAIARRFENHTGKSIEVRGYVSTAFGCPFEGSVSPKKALRVVERLAELGVSQVSIGDTIGVATPPQIEAVLKPAVRAIGAPMVAGHFHDTRGTALANVCRALELGVRTFDSSAGGLGGCPFAPSASGNLATEDLLYLLDGYRMRTGVDLEKVCETSLWLARTIRRPLTSRYLQTYATAKRASMRLRACVGPSSARRN